MRDYTCIYHKNPIKICDIKTKQKQPSKNSGSYIHHEIMKYVT